ncbi:hypothetical protein [Catellatospora vulcania]|uniref:hypothetical protein n=1 Tax=Catellatospora vulcania TaxID=1460450 RepID=UPI0012D46C14|nr:hypothetical protein [Catellatospora vulcania]
MKVEASTEQLIARLDAVVWDERLDRNGSRMKLMQEYLRRSALWARALGRTEYWPFFDIASFVDPAARIDEQTAAAVRRRMGETGARPMDVTIVRYLLDFSTLEFWPDGLPDPFEPLLMVYERGGPFDREAGRVLIGSAVGIPEGTWEKYVGRPPLDDVSPAALDQLDEAWLARRAERARAHQAGVQHRDS